MRVRRSSCAIVARIAFVMQFACATGAAHAQDCAAAWDADFVGSAPNGVGLAACIDGQDIYIGGGFLTIDGINASRIAHWDGEDWSAMGSGLNNRVNAIVPFDAGDGAKLIVGGVFTTAGGAFASKIAAWDGSQWSALGSGMQVHSTAIVRALHVFDDGDGDALYAGGVFTTAGGVTVTNIAKWNGSAWSALGSGLNGPVFALASHDDGTGPALYAAGGFSATGDGATALHRVAKWDGQSWTNVGDGFNDDVLALASASVGGAPAQLFAGGLFTESGIATPLSRVATLNGGAWSALGVGVNYTVRALAFFEDANGPSLIVGGDFFTAGGQQSLFTTRWDGASWSALGSGLSGSSGSGVHGLATGMIDGAPTLAAAGIFTSPTDNAARWTSCAGAANPADLNGDGAVNGADLGLLLGLWGSEGPDGDLNGDSVVNGADLGLLLGSWAS